MDGRVKSLSLTGLYVQTGHRQCFTQRDAWVLMAGIYLTEGTTLLYPRDVERP